MLPSELIALPREVRCKVKFKKRKNKCYLYRGIKFDRDYLVYYLRGKGFKSKRELHNGRKGWEPSCSHYIKEFGSWGEAKRFIWGIDGVAWNKEARTDPEYMVKAVIQFNLWRWVDYIAFRRKHPDLVPSYYQILREWGSFDTLKRVAAASSFKGLVVEYLKICKRMKRIVSRQEVEQLYPNLDNALKKIGGWHDLVSMASQLEGINEK